MTPPEVNGGKQFEACVKVKIDNSFDMVGDSSKNNSCILLSTNYVLGSVLDSLHRLSFTITILKRGVLLATVKLRERPAFLQSPTDGKWWGVG